MIEHDDKKRATPVFDSESYWGREKFEYDGSDQTIYIGRNKVQNASTALADWYISKITWDTGNITDVELLIGSWDNRATLNWN